MPPTTAEQITVPTEYLKELEEGFAGLVRMHGTKISNVIEDECLTHKVLTLGKLKAKYGLSHRLSNICE